MNYNSENGSFCNGYYAPNKSFGCSQSFPGTTSNGYFVPDSGFMKHPIMQRINRAQTINRAGEVFNEFGNKAGTVNQGRIESDDPRYDGKKIDPDGTVRDPDTGDILGSFSYKE